MLPSRPAYTSPLPVRPTTPVPCGPRRVNASPPPLPCVTRLVVPVAFLVTRDVFAQSSPRRTPVDPQLPYTFDPWIEEPTAPVRGLYAWIAPRAPAGPYAAAPRAHVPVDGL